VDRAAGRLLAAQVPPRRRRSLYDPGYTEKITSGPEHRKLAVEAAQKAVVLLKNEKNLLPLDLGKLKTIAVIGPTPPTSTLADTRANGTWRSAFWMPFANGSGSSAKVVYAEGCQITTAKQGWRGWLANNVKLADPQAQAEKVAAATELARTGPTSPSWWSAKTKAPTAEAWAEYHLGASRFARSAGAQNDWSSRSSKPALPP